MYKAPSLRAGREVPVVGCIGKADTFWCLPSILLVTACLFIPPVQAANPIAEAYSKFIRSLAYGFTNDAREMMNTELQSKQVEFNGQVVTYQYQLWRLRPNSVCANLKNDLLAYSRCGRTAQQLFFQTCQHLTNTPGDNWKHDKLKQLYCNAATQYQPTIAEIRKSKNTTSADQARRQQCSILRMESLRSKDPNTIRQRDEACKDIN